MSDTVKTFLAVMWLFSPMILFLVFAAIIEHVDPITRAFDRFCDRLDAWTDRLLK